MSGHAGAVTLASDFRSTFGRSPDGVWSAPGRVNLIGEHTDYNGGLVVPIALPQRVTVAAARRDDQRLILRSARHTDDHRDLSIDDLRPGSVDGWAAYVAGVVWALRLDGHDVGGVDVLTGGDLPIGSGLSSSAALEAATATCLIDLFDLQIEPMTLARTLQRAENEFVGVPCGIMDQAACLMCRSGHALLLDTRSLHAEHVPFDLGAAGLTLLVIDTCTHHDLADGQYAERRRSCERAAEQLEIGLLADLDVDQLPDVLDRLDDDVLRRRVRHVVTENERVRQAVEVLRSGRLDELGPLLTASHRSLRDDYEVSCPELDAAVDAALLAGAHGARMTGGGFGGCAIALVDKERQSDVTRRIERTIARSRFPPPHTFAVIPSAGALALRPPIDPASR